MAVIGGDVIGFPALASTSMEQARVAMVHAFQLQYKEKVSSVLPYAIYTIPEISLVGLTEDDCLARKIPFLVGRSHYRDNPRGQIIGEFILAVYNYPTLADAYKYAAYDGLGELDRWHRSRQNNP